MLSQRPEGRTKGYVSRFLNGVLRGATHVCHEDHSSRGDQVEKRLNFTMFFEQCTDIIAVCLVLEDHN